MRQRPHWRQTTMEQTKQQKLAIKIVEEALSLNGEVDNIETCGRAMGGLAVTYLMTDKKKFCVDVTKAGVISCYGSSRLGLV